MISLEGLTLATGRHVEAGYILRTFAHYVRDGLIPNMFPEGENEGLYHTADATLWFFHALDRYLAGDRRPRHAAAAAAEAASTSSSTTCAARASASASIRPTACCSQGAEGYQLTWMDAKVGDWVVTPRRGKAVEINALWYNALRSAARRGCARTATSDAAATWPSTPSSARASFNARFWNAEGGLSLRRRRRRAAATTRRAGPTRSSRSRCRIPSSTATRWEPVLDVVRDRLLTPVGLRSLAPGSPDYKPQYYGDLRSRDAAYHQGTVWAWLIGPFVDAWLKVHPDDRAGARAVPRRLRAPSERGVHRLDQRNLRRRAAVHAARLHRPGLERRRSAALLAQDSVRPTLNRAER